jgi:hypothetical protein
MHLILHNAVLHDVDIDTNTPPNDAATHRKINNLIAILSNGRSIHKFQHKLETTLNLAEHLKDQYKANQLFSDLDNINADLEQIVAGIFGG